MLEPQEKIYVGNVALATGKRFHSTEAVQECKSSSKELVASRGAHGEVSRQPHQLVVHLQ